MAYKLRVLGVPFGGHLHGKDLDGEYFDDQTDTGLEDVGRIGVYWHHGRDKVTRRIGTADGWTKTREGWWCDVTVTDEKLADPIRRMAEAGSLFASSGAVSHLVERGAQGHLKRWLVGELSLTANPANRLAVAKLVEPEPASQRLTEQLDRLEAETYALQEKHPTHVGIQHGIGAVRYHIDQVRRAA